MNRDAWIRAADVWPGPTKTELRVAFEAALSHGRTSQCVEVLVDENDVRDAAAYGIAAYGEAANGSLLRCTPSGYIRFIARLEESLPIHLVRVRHGDGFKDVWVREGVLVYLDDSTTKETI